MDIRNDQIGFDRRIRLEWMELAANLMSLQLPVDDIRQKLLDEISNHLSVGKSTVNRGSGEKAFTIITRTWINVPDELIEFRNDGLDLFQKLPKNYHLAVHWGMTMAIYPFWAAIAFNVGRLLSLQSVFTSSQIQRRIEEIYGQRPTIKDASRRVLRSMIDWSVISEAPGRASFQQKETIVLNNPHLIAWLIEAQLHSSIQKKAPLRSVIHADCLFPFKIDNQTGNQFSSFSNRLEIINHGLDDSLVVLTSKE